LYSLFESDVTNTTQHNTDISLRHGASASLIRNYIDQTWPHEMHRHLASPRSWELTRGMRFVHVSPCLSICGPRAALINICSQYLVDAPSHHTVYNSCIPTKAKDSWHSDS
jgi:hypothetical protein